MTKRIYMGVVAYADSKIGKMLSEVYRSERHFSRLVGTLLMAELKRDGPSLACR